MPSDKEKHDTKILAVAGKGGVGKTSIAASIVRLLAENHPDSRILAIDADPRWGCPRLWASRWKLPLMIFAKPS